MIDNPTGTNDSNQKEIDDKFFVDLKNFEKDPSKDPIVNNFNIIYFIVSKQNKKEKYVAKSSSIPLNADNIINYSREIKIMMYIQHPTLIKFLGFSYRDLYNRPNITIVTKYMPNGTLTDLLRTPINNTQKQIILVGISLGMMILHYYHVIHRDLKADNVLIDENGYPCISDFDVSKLFDPNDPTKQTSKYIGTPVYMAPEVFSNNGDPNFDTKIDVYSFGILMHQVITGIYPYSDKFDLEKEGVFNLQRMVDEGLRPTVTDEMKDLYPGLTDMFTRCWEKDPNVRPIFIEIFKKLSLLTDEDFQKYRETLPFLVNSVVTEVLPNDKIYSFDNVDIEKVKSYSIQMLNAFQPKQTLKIESKFTNTVNICSDFFTLYSTNNVTNNDFSAKHKESLRNLSLMFPKVSEISTFLDNISSGSFNLVMDIFVFKAFSEDMKSILHNNDLFDEKSLKIISYYTFFAWLSITLSLFKGGKFDCTVLLSLLNRIIKTDSEYSTIAYSCFVDIIYVSIEKNSIVDINKILEEMSVFYLENDKIVHTKQSRENLISIVYKYIKNNEQMTNQSISIINLISKILEKSSDFFIDSFALLLTEPILISILNFEIFYLKFFLKIAIKVKYQAEMITKKLLDKFLDKNDEDLNQTNIQIKAIKNNFPDKISKRFWLPEDLYQIEKITESGIKDIIKINELTDIFDSKTVSIILIIEEIITIDKIYSQYLISETIKKIQNINGHHSKRIFYKKYSILFYLIYSVLKKFPDIEIEELNLEDYQLFFKLVFDPDVTYFNKNSNFETAFYLRNFVLRFLFTKQINAFYQIIQEYSNYSDLFREIIHHLILIRYCYEDATYDFKEVSDILMSYLVKYRINSNTLIHTEDEIKFLTIRKTILFYFELFPIKNDFSGSILFANCYCILLIEPPIREIFISFLSNYLNGFDIQRKSNDFTSLLFDKILKLIQICCNKMQPDEAIKLISVIVETLGKEASLNELLSDELKKILPSLYQSIINLNLGMLTMNQNDKFIAFLIDFWYDVYQNKVINTSDIEPIELLINHFLPNLSQVKIIEKLIRFIAKDNVSTNLKPMFEIKDSAFICPLVRIFLMTENLYNVINYISILCSFSRKNCIKCHDCGLDLLIIELFSKWRKSIDKINKEHNKIMNVSYDEIQSFEYYFQNGNNSFILKNDEISENLIDLFFNLFLQIALNASSISIVHGFFSMLNTFKNNNSICLSLIHEKMINLLNEILKSSKFLPETSLTVPSVPNPICISSLSANLFKNGLSFVFWISKSYLIDSYPQTLLELTEERQAKKPQSFKLQMVEDNLRVMIKSTSTFLDFNFDVKIAYNKWTMIAITLVPIQDNKNSSILSLYINQEKTNSQKIEIQFTPNSHVNCIISNSNLIPKYLNVDSHLISNFILSSPLTDEEITNIANKGQRSLLSFNKSIFSYSNLMGINEPIKMSSIFDVLVDNCKLDIIIPIFQQSGIKLKDGSEEQFIDVLCCQILFNLFRISENIQKSFYNSDFFYSISNFLQLLDGSKLTFDLYIHYFDLLKEISYKDLRIQLIDEILMNFNLWSKSDIGNQKKIFHHWNKELYEQHKKIIKSIRQVEWYFVLILNCDAVCRQSLYLIVSKIHKHKMNLQTILMILSIIIEEDSLIIKKEMLYLLKSILPKVKIIGLINVFDILNPLYVILDFQTIDDEIFGLVISLFICINNISSDKKEITFYMQMLNIAAKLNKDEKYLVSIGEFEALISLMNDNKASELLPILCVSVIKGGQDYLNILFKNIDVTLNYYHNEESLLYPVFLMLKYDNSTPETSQLIVSLFKQNIFELIYTIYAIDFLGFNSIKLDKIKHNVFLNILKMDAKNLEITMINNIYDFIFYRIDNKRLLTSLLTCKNDLEQIFKSFEVSSDENITEFINNFNLLIEILQANNFEFRSNLIHHQVRLRTEKNKWQDIDLAKNLFEHYKKNNRYELKGIINILFSCLYNYEHIYVINEKAKLNKQLQLKLIDKFDINKYKMVPKNIKALIENTIKTIKIILDFFKSFKITNKEQFQDSYQCYLSIFKSIEEEINNQNNDSSNNQHKTAYKRINSFSTRFYPCKVIKKSFSIPLKQKQDSSSDKQIERFNLSRKDIIFNCTLNKIKRNRNAELQINKQSIKIQQIEGNIIKIIPSDYIYTINFSSQDGKSSQVQIFDKFGQNYDLTFDEMQFKKLTDFVSNVSLIENKKFQELNSLDSLINLWRDLKISNFEYLLYLNILKGRSFNNPKCYPIFPWILSDYQTKTLDIKSSSTYRNFSKPINMQKDDKSNFMQEDYSDELTIYYWLARIEPFKTNFKDRKYLYTRSFESITESYKDATTMQNECKELIPEFFFFPEFLRSKELGDVKLPPWSNQSAFEFIYLHRKALESTHVSLHINEWINLIFGENLNTMKNNFVHKSSIPLFNGSELQISSNSEYNISTDNINSEYNISTENTNSEYNISTENTNSEYNISTDNTLSEYNFNSETSSLPKSNSFDIAEVSSSVDFTLEFNVDYFDIKFKEVTSVVCGYVFFDPEKSSLCFSVVDSKGNIFFYSIHSSSIKKENFTVKSKKKIIHKEKYLISPPKFIDSNQFCFIDKDMKSVKIVNCQDGTIEKSIEKVDKITSFETNSEGLIAISTEDCSITIYDVNHLPVLKQPSSPFKLLARSSSMMISIPYSSEIFSFQGQVNHIAMNTAFHICVCGTNENSLLFCELNLDKFRINRVVKTEETIQNIIITDNFGFVAVLIGNLSKELVLYSVNGDKIGSTYNNIKYLTKASSSPGKFDYLIASDNNNFIYVFEAFYLVIDKPIFRCNSKIMQITYINEESLIVALCEDGTVSVIYYPINDSD